MSSSRTSFKSFSESTPEDWAIIEPQLATTQRLAIENILEQLSRLRSDHGGFPVNRLEHCLQTATRAERDGRDDEYVFCALLHDIGDTMAPFNHPAVAAAIVKPFVSDANHWMVLHHGVFQGYYYWHYIGQNRLARERFRGSPYFEYTEEFCAKYDEVSFDIDYHNAPLEHFEPLIRSILGAEPARRGRQ